MSMISLKKDPSKESKEKQRKYLINKNIDLSIASFLIFKDFRSWALCSKETKANFHDNILDPIKKKFENEVEKISTAKVEEFPEIYREIRKSKLNPQTQLIEINFREEEYLYYKLIQRYVNLLNENPLEKPSLLLNSNEELEFFFKFLFNCYLCQNLNTLNISHSLKWNDQTQSNENFQCFDEFKANEKINGIPMEIYKQQLSYSKIKSVFMEINSQGLSPLYKIMAFILPKDLNTISIMDANHIFKKNIDIEERNRIIFNDLLNGMTSLKELSLSKLYLTETGLTNFRNIITSIEQNEEEEHSKKIFKFKDIIFRYESKETMENLFNSFKRFNSLELSADGCVWSTDPSNTNKVYDLFDYLYGLFLERNKYRKIYYGYNQILFLMHPKKIENAIKFLAKKIKEGVFEKSKLPETGVFKYNLVDSVFEIVDKKICIQFKSYSKENDFPILKALKDSSENIEVEKIYYKNDPIICANILEDAKKIGLDLGKFEEKEA